MLGLRGHMNRGWSGEGGLRPRPIPPGGKIELAPLPLSTLAPTGPVGGSILVPRDVAPMGGGGTEDPPPGAPLPPVLPGGESPPPDPGGERPPRGFVAVAPRTGPIPRPIPVVPRPLPELCK